MAKSEKEVDHLWSWEKLDISKDKSRRWPLILLDNIIWAGSSNDGMIAFDVITKSCQVFKFPQQIIVNPKYFSLCLYNRIIYLIENVRRSHYRILSFNPNTKEYKLCTTIATKDNGYAPCCLLVQDTIHIIGENRYQIYCTSSNTMKYVDNEYEMGMRGSVLITRYKDTMIRFGGCNRGPLDDFYIFRNIDQYNKLEKIKWTLKSEWTLLHGLEACAFVIYKNYLITIGGHGGPFASHMDSSATKPSIYSRH